MGIVLMFGKKSKSRLVGSRLNDGHSKLTVGSPFTAAAPLAKVFATATRRMILPFSKLRSHTLVGQKGPRGSK